MTSLSSHFSSSLLYSASACLSICLSLRLFVYSSNCFSSFLTFFVLYFLFLSFFLVDERTEKNNQKIQKLKLKNLKCNLIIIFPFLLERKNANDNENEIDKIKNGDEIENNMIYSYASIIHQLINPYVHILYISSIDMTRTEMLRHIDNLEKLRSVNIADIRRRFHFVAATLSDFFPKSKINPSIDIYSTSIVYTKGRVQDRINYYLSIFPLVTFIPINYSATEVRICQAFKIPNSLNSTNDLNEFHSKSCMKKVILLSYNNHSNISDS